MGFEPIIQSDGTWSVGASGRLTYLDQWRDRPTAYSASGSGTCSNTSYMRIIPSNTLPSNRIYVVYFKFTSTGAPWILNSCITYATVRQNGDSFSSRFVPMICHADNGSTILTRFKAGDAGGHISSGLDAQIYGQEGRVGTWEVYCWDLGVI